MAAALEALSSCLPKVRIPGLGDNVYKEECCLSFDTPESNGGLYVCLTTFLGFSEKYVKLYNRVTHNRAFLRIKKTKKVVPSTVEHVVESPSEKPKRLAIGVEGGFHPDEDDKVEYDEVNAIVILPEFFEISLGNIEEIPSLVLASVSGVLSSTAASKKEEALVWDGDMRPITKHAASLEQLSNGVKIPPSGWRCAKCEITKNLWLNLSDGMILCGRKYYDCTGGNNHAVDHFKDTGFPLAVKLGTITANGADVHSYDEDNMVEDPELGKHLAHFGINMLNMTQTEQTMTEMEIELNQKIGSEWNIIQEAGKNLKELSGPWLTGLKNMGNTCYLNSVFQVFLSIPEFQQHYADSETCLEVFEKNLLSLSWDPANSNSGLGQFADNQAKLTEEIQRRAKSVMFNFAVQMCKIGLALSQPPNASVDIGDDRDCLEESTSEKPKHASHAIAPRSLKLLVGKDHLDFSTNRQQDAHEFFLHVLNIIERAEHRSDTFNVGNLFKFMTEERVECQQSKQVRYSKRPDYAIALPIPMDLATNKTEMKAYRALKEANAKDGSVMVGDVVRARVPFSACVDCFFQEESLQGFWSSAVQEKAEARKITRFSTFPDYLVIQMKKFTVGEDWIPKKLDVSVEVPDVLDLNEYRGGGLQAGETLLPDIDPPTPVKDAPPVMEVDEEAILAITQMGFPVDRCREAIIATCNTGIESAVMWLMENTGNNADVTAVPVEHGPSEDGVITIMAMGFTREQALKALRATDNNLERAADWIFSHIDELDAIDVPSVNLPESSISPVAGDCNVAMDTNQPTGVTDGSGNYQLFAFISHMGTSTMSGHYVCHIKKDGRWVIFNDEKVAASELPPKDLGYIYFYKRMRQ